jgi:cytidylate kinase
MNDATHLGHLIDRQVSLWDAKKRLPVEGAPPARGAVAPRTEGPWITISTQLGSRGDELAEALGSRLGWQVFDKEILAAIAESTHTREKILSRLDGRAASAFEDYAAHLFVPGDLGRSAFVVELMRVLWAIARHGDAIMVGRGANWMLDPRYGLRVRAIAAIDKRVEWLRRAEAISIAEATRRVEKDNAERARFTRQVYKQDIDNPLGYDLVVNVGTLDIQPTVDVVVAALASKLSAAA